MTSPSLDLFIANQNPQSIATLTKFVAFTEETDRANMIGAWRSLPNPDDLTSQGRQAVCEIFWSLATPMVQLNREIKCVQAAGYILGSLEKEPEAPIREQVIDYLKDTYLRPDFFNDHRDRAVSNALGLLMVYGSEETAQEAAACVPYFLTQTTGSIKAYQGEMLIDVLALSTYTKVKYPDIILPEPALNELEARSLRLGVEFPSELKSQSLKKPLRSVEQPQPHFRT